MKRTYFRFIDLFLGFCFGLGPFFIIAGVLSIFKVIPIYYNEAPHYGLKAFLVSIVEVPLFSLILGFSAWLTLNVGVFVQNLFIKRAKAK
jgi:hypothetical protein